MYLSTPVNQPTYLYHSINMSYHLPNQLSYLLILSTYLFIHPSTFISDTTDAPSHVTAGHAYLEVNAGLLFVESDADCLQLSREEFLLHLTLCHIHHHDHQVWRPRHSNNLRRRRREDSDLWHFLLGSWNCIPYLGPFMWYSGPFLLPNAPNPF